MWDGRRGSTFEATRERQRRTSMYPPVKQFDTRRREAEEWIAAREARRVAEASTTTAGAGPRSFARMPGRARSLFGPKPGPSLGGGRVEPALRASPQLPAGREQRGLGDTITIRLSKPEDRDAILCLCAL